MDAQAPAAAGLTSAEAARRLARFGPNEPVPVQRLSVLVEVGRLFANPLIAILLAAAFISSLLGQHADALIITTMVVLGAAINFWQSFQSRRAADRLRQSVSPTATVRRDGDWAEVPLRLVVPGDVVRLSAGDLVPADARLLEARDLSVQQSLLTGESLPVDKAATANAPSSGDEASTDALDRVFLGTSVISGSAIALALETGPRTLFGDVALRLRARAPDTEFELGLHRFSLLILRTTVALVLFIVLAGVMLRHDPLESLLFAVALGVGLTPEFLPIVTSIALTRGALRMARDHVIVKHLPAIQNFGSIDVLCSDKTGTLTTGVMAVDRVAGPTGASGDRALALAHVNARFETGIRSPLDQAILARAAPSGPAYEKVDEIPFDFDRRCLSVVVAVPGGGERILITKGAPEAVLQRSVSVELEGGVVPLDASLRLTCGSVHEAWSALGLRVLAVSYRIVPDQAVYGRSDEHDLVLAGFVGFSDPVLPDVAETLAELKRDGVTVKILTGDNELVARHLCDAIGLAGSGRDHIVTGAEVSRLDDAALGHVAEHATVFSRVSPSQKNRILLALKRRGHVVGFLGDGINDAPSLRTADVGISVVTATDVARDAADIVLGEGGLRVLHRGILEGRRASGNLMKYLLMGTSSNFGNMFSMAAASLFLPFLPMLPTQILLNNFLYDLAQVTIPSDNVDDDYLRRPQRWDMRVVRDFMIGIGPISSLYDFLTFFVLLRVFHAPASLFHTGWFVESLATQTLVLFVIRTMGNPLRSRPSWALTATTLAVVIGGAMLPFTPLAGPLRLVPLPPAFFMFLIGVNVTYLTLVQVAKRRLVLRLGLTGPPVQDRPAEAD